MSYLQYVWLYAAINGLMADITHNDSHATGHQYVCDMSRMEVVDEYYQVNDIPSIEVIKKCQSMISADPDMASPRPCALRVKISMTLIDLMDIDGIRGSIQMLLTYREEWEDRRLVLPAQMNPECVDNSSLKSSMHLTPSRQYRDAIWTPDFYMKGMMGIHVAKVGLTAEDLILRSNYVIESTLTLTLLLMCPMHFSNFPFDTHHCNITIESYGMFVDDLAIVWGDPSVTMEESFKMGGYKISIATSKPTSVTYISYSFPRLVVTLIISRQRLRYTLLIFMPCTLHFLIAWLAFFLPKEVSQGRCIINCTTNLSLISMLSVYMRYSPQGGHLKAFDVWVVCSMLFQFLCTIDSIIDIRLLYLAFNLRRQPEQPIAAEVVQLVTDSDNWLGREMRHVEPEISGTMVHSAVHEMRRLSVSLASARTLSGLSQRRSSVASQRYIGGPRPSVVRYIQEDSIYSSETYQKFLRVLVRYQEWSQWIYLGAYMLFVWLYWYINVPDESD